MPNKANITDRAPPIQGRHVIYGQSAELWLRLARHLTHLFTNHHSYPRRSLLVTPCSVSCMSIPLLLLRNKVLSANLELN